MNKRGDIRREDILDYISLYRSVNGISPSVAEMADGLGTVKSNIYHHLRILEDSGVISHHRGAARSWLIRDNG